MGSADRPGKMDEKLEGENKQKRENFENLTTKWCILKYI